MAADAIVPDDKDWTWVLHATCAECGFDVSALPATDVARLIRENAAAWTTALRAPADDVRVRRRPDRWSSLEYGAHVRDVYRLFHERLRRMLREDDPLFANWDQDVTARNERYGEQEPGRVGVELADAAVALADEFERVRGDQWLRPGRRSDGASFTIESFSRYLIHDPVHHLWDIGGNRAAGVAES